MNVDFDRLCEDLGPYLFDVCGVPNMAKSEVFISHEHRDEVPDPGELLLRYSNAAVYMSNETLAVLKQKTAMQGVLYAFRVNFKERFKVCPTEYMWYGKVWDVNGVHMFRIEHDSPDPLFRSHVAFGFAKPGLFCYFSEATGDFLLKYGGEILKQVGPRYVIVSPPSMMHKLSVGRLEEFNCLVNRAFAVLLMTANFVSGDKIFKAEEIGMEPSDFLVLPKLVKSTFDTHGPAV